MQLYKTVCGLYDERILWHACVLVLCDNSSNHGYTVPQNAGKQLWHVVWQEPLGVRLIDTQCGVLASSLQLADR